MSDHVTTLCLCPKPTGLLTTAVIQEVRPSPALPPAACCNRNPPAFYLAELGVGQIHHQGQAGHPYIHLQLGAQETVGEVEHHLALSSRLLPIDINRVTSLWHLDTDDKTKIDEWLFQSLTVCLCIVEESDFKVFKSVKNERQGATLLKSGRGTAPCFCTLPSNVSPPQRAVMWDRSHWALFEIVGFTATSLI